MFLHSSFHPAKRCIGQFVSCIRCFKTHRSNEYLKYAENQQSKIIVRRRTDISSNHLTPEIKLRLFNPAALDLGLDGKDDIFWAFYWPGGQALSRFILDNPKSLQNLSVVDIGSGCGATAIAAVMARAKKVVANDCDRTACIATSINAEMNGIQLEILQDNIFGVADLPWDCILVGDMFYSEECTYILRWLKQFHIQGKNVLIGDPGRFFFEKSSVREDLKLLAEYNLPAHVTEENRGFTHGYRLFASLIYKVPTYSTFHANVVSRFMCSYVPQHHEYYLNNSQNSDKIKLIKKYTQLSRNHLTPEIALHLITDECDAWYWKPNEIEFMDPFWAFYWPGGQALSRFILDNAIEVQNSTVLDVGCGCGASAIAAAYANAKYVVANDINTDSCIVTALNAEINHSSLKISQTNYIGDTNIPWDCILIGDMFYREELSKMIFEWLRILHHKGKKIFIGDPGRYNDEDRKFNERLKLLKTYDLKKDYIVENDRFSSVNVLTFY